MNAQTFVSFVVSSVTVRLYQVLAVLFTLGVCSEGKAVTLVDSANAAEQVAPGVWKLRIAEPESMVPSAFRVAPVKTELLQSMEPVTAVPFAGQPLRYELTDRGLLIYLPMVEGEDWYGGGLLLHHFRQTGRRQVLKVTSDPLVANGSGHAPVPFYASTGGYGFLIDSAREIEICFGGHSRLGSSGQSNTSELGVSEADLYGMADKQSKEISILIPRATGVDMFLFGGPQLQDTVRRHILFSGGGFDVPEWGLGVWYRGYTRADEAHIRRLADALQKDHIPCSVFGLEPGWQSRAYSSSFVWSEDRFPDPEGLCAYLKGLGYKINLWQHAFTHPESPLYESLKPLSGDHLVWNGLVPDFTLKEARTLFADYQRRHVDLGISGFKLDECDNSDTKSQPWSWPDHAQYPGGADGEQMHGLYGLLYMQTMQEALDGKPTFGQVRQAGAFCSPLPYVLYSDLYEHRAFLRGIGSASISGLIWTPEVRHGLDGDDLVQRLSAMVLAPQFLINAWYCTMPPWHQPDKPLNQAGVPMPDDERLVLTERVREICELRVQFVPYLKQAFQQYEKTGLPPFRPPVVDYPDVVGFRDTDDAWLVGNEIYVAPIPSGESERIVQIPPGDWKDYYSGQVLLGPIAIEVKKSRDAPPIYVRSSTAGNLVFE